MKPELARRLRAVRDWLPIVRRPGVYWMIGCFDAEPPIAVTESLPGPMFGQLIRRFPCGGEAFAWTRDLLSEELAPAGDPDAWPDWAGDFACLECRHVCKNVGDCPCFKSVRHAIDKARHVGWAVTESSMNVKSVFHFPAVRRPAVGEGDGSQVDGPAARVDDLEAGALGARPGSAVEDGDGDALPSKDERGDRVEDAEDGARDGQAGFNGCVHAAKSTKTHT